MAARVLSVDIGRTHYALCCLDMTRADSKVTLVDLRLVKLGDSSAVPLTTLVDRMICILEEYPPFAEKSPDCVLIEQQMRAAPKNLALAFATYTYFRARGVLVKMVRPSQKFEGWRTWCPALEMPRADHSKQSYYQRKKASVSLAQAVLDHLGMPLLETHVADGHKLDDVADSFLQALCFA